jgi:hypothetical protein
MLKLPANKKDPTQKPSVAFQSVLTALKGKRKVDGFKGARPPQKGS